MFRLLINSTLNELRELVDLSYMTVMGIGMYDDWMVSIYVLFEKGREGTGFLTLQCIFGECISRLEGEKLSR